MCLSISPHEMRKLVERVFKINSLKPNAAFLNNASWCTDTDGLLEYSSREGSLYYQDPPLQEPIQDTTLHLVIISRGFCGVFLGLSLFLTSVTVLRSAGQVFCRSPFYWDYSEVMGLEEDDHRGKVPFSSLHIKSTYYTVNMIYHN